MITRVRTREARAAETFRGGGGEPKERLKWSAIRSCLAEKFVVLSILPDIQARCARKRGMVSRSRASHALTTRIGLNFAAAIMFM
ncbi:MAG TPA: hypothetical protein VGC86_06285 [Afipia sp.]